LNTWFIFIKVHVLFLIFTFHQTKHPRVETNFRLNFAVTEMPIDNNGSSILLQQLLSGQRSINSLNMTQQQTHGKDCPI